MSLADTAVHRLPMPSRQVNPLDLELLRLPAEEIIGQRGSGVAHARKVSRLARDGKSNYKSCRLKGGISTVTLLCLGINTGLIARPSLQQKDIFS